MISAGSSLERCSVTCFQFDSLAHQFAGEFGVAFGIRTNAQLSNTVPFIGTLGKAAGKAKVAVTLVLTLSNDVALINDVVFSCESIASVGKPATHFVHITHHIHATGLDRLIDSARDSNFAGLHVQRQSVDACGSLKGAAGSVGTQVKFLIEHLVSDF